MKRILLLLAVLFPSPILAQFVGPIAITSSQCAQISTDSQATVAMYVFGTWTGTLQPQGTIQGQTAFNIPTEPSTSTTLQNTITANGAYVAAVAGYSTFLLCGNTVASGTANVYLQVSTSQLGSTIGSGSSYVPPVTTKGDLFTFSNSPTRLGVGSNGQCLTAQSGQTTGLLWASCATALGFNQLTSGTNTTAAMLVGSGASLRPTGTGTITPSFPLLIPTSSDPINIPQLAPAALTTSGFNFDPPSGVFLWTDSAGAGAPLYGWQATQNTNGSSGLFVVAGIGDPWLGFANSWSPPAVPTCGACLREVNSGLASEAGSTGVLAPFAASQYTLGSGTAMTANQGNGASLQHSTGATTTNHLVKYDANGNAVDSGSTGAAPTGTAGGDLSGTYPNPAVAVVTNATSVTSAVFKTATNCANGASPAVCGSAASGAVALPTGTNPTLTVNTSAVTATSRIMLTVDESLTIAATTCNTTLSTLLNPVVTARSPGTSFTFTIGAVIASNPACVSYVIFD